MKIAKGIKIRLYPTKTQEVVLAITFGSKRFVWNQMLAERQGVYQALKADKSALHAYKYRTEKEYKAMFPFLKDADSMALQQARIDLQDAFQRFFNHLSRYPRFKSKRGRQSYRTNNVNACIKVNVKRRKIKLPKLGWIAYRDNRAFTGVIKSVTVSKTKSGKYFASILVNQEIEIEQMTTIQESKIAAFDMSAKEFLVSEIKRYENPRFYRSNETKLKHLHRQVSRKTKGSSNRDKARIRLARLYDRIGNQRNDFQQKLSTELASEHDAIIIEDLNIEGMKRWNGSLAKSVTLDSSWNEFTRMLEYKMAWRGKHLVKIDRFFPSSKMCSACGFINHGLALDDREWTCPSCGMHHDREVNAAINIKREGINTLRHNNITVITSDNTVGTTEIHAFGDSARPVATMARIDEERIHVL